MYKIHLTFETPWFSEWFTTTSQPLRAQHSIKIAINPFIEATPKEDPTNQTHFSLTTRAFSPSRCPRQNGTTISPDGIKSSAYTHHKGKNSPFLHEPPSKNLHTEMALSVNVRNAGNDIIMTAMQKKS